MNNLALAASLATSPSAAFADLRERPRFLFPLILCVVSMAGLAYWYYSAVDFEWFKQNVIAVNPDIAKLPEDQRTAIVQNLPHGQMLWGSLIGAALGIPFVFLISALYYWVAAKITKVRLGFKHWFTLVCWTALPMVLSAIIAAILLLLRDNDQILPGILQPLSLNELVLHRPLGTPGQALFEAINIPAILSLVLAAIGVKTWSERSWLFSAVFVGIPMVLMFGIWAFFAFR